MSPGAADILTRITTAAMRLGMGYLLAGRTRDAEQLATSLEALGHVPPVDVDAIEAGRGARYARTSPRRAARWTRRPPRRAMA